MNNNFLVRHGTVYEGLLRLEKRVARLERHVEELEKPKMNEWLIGREIPVDAVSTRFIGVPPGYRFVPAGHLSIYNTVPTPGQD
jgi:hypothetical protein